MKRLLVVLAACATSRPIEVAPPPQTSTIAAPDGEGRWTVAIDHGALVRVLPEGEREPIADRLGLGDRPILDMRGADATFAARLGEGVAISHDGHHLMVFEVPGVEQIAVAPERVALALRDRTELWDLRAKTRRRFSVHATAIAFSDGALLVTTPRGTFVEHGATLVPARLAAVATDAWQTAIAPIFKRVCAHCHLPGGDAGVDLSTPAAWRDERAELRDRVLDTRTMPPAGFALTEPERATLARWLH